jgi:hypothetical protein
MKDKYKKYIEYIVNDIEAPYIKYLNMYGLSDNEMDLVLSKVYNQSVTIKGNYVYDPNHNKIYGEDSNGFWFKREYDQNNNKIYFEDSNGFWVKQEYDTNGNVIYREYSNGEWIKYDSNGNNIYYEDGNGFWYKREYDSNGKVIYHEGFDGVIIDNR